MSCFCHGDVVQYFHGNFENARFSSMGPVPHPRVKSCHGDLRTVLHNSLGVVVYTPPRNAAQWASQNQRSELSNHPYQTEISEQNAGFRALNGGSGEHRGLQSGARVQEQLWRAVRQRSGSFESFWDHAYVRSCISEQILGVGTTANGEILNPRHTPRLSGQLPT